MKYLLSFIFHIGFCLAAGAQENAAARPATLYIMRATGMTGVGAFSAFIDDELACRLNNNCYSIHIVRPGLHMLQVTEGGKQPKKKVQVLELVMEPGETYYVSMNVTNRAYWSSLYLMEVTVNTAKKMLPSLKEDTHCK